MDKTVIDNAEEKLLWYEERSLRSYDHKRIKRILTNSVKDAKNDNSSSKPNSISYD